MRLWHVRHAALASRSDIVAGFLFALHGLQKLFHLWLPPGVHLDTQAYIGGVIELVAGVMIMLGALAFVLLLSLLVTERALRALNELRRTAERVAGGDLSPLPPQNLRIIKQ